MLIADIPVWSIPDDVGALTWMSRAMVFFAVAQAGRILIWRMGNETRRTNPRSHK